MSRWPQDHPGRTCAKCGENVYWLWSDPVYPPPGVCMFDMPHPRYCDNFRAGCINHLQIARALDRAPAPEFLQRLERANCTLDEAIIWRDDFVAKQEAADAKLLKSLGIDSFNVPARTTEKGNG